MKSMTDLHAYLLEYLVISKMLLASELTNIACIIAVEHVRASARGKKCRSSPHHFSRLLQDLASKHWADSVHAKCYPVVGNSFPC